MKLYNQNKLKNKFKKRSLDMFIKVWNSNKKFVGTLFVASEKELEMASKIYPNWEFIV